MGILKLLNAPLFERSMFLKRLKSLVAIPFFLVAGVGLIALAIWFGLDGTPLSKTMWRVALGIVVIDIGILLWLKKTRWATRPWILIPYLVPWTFIVAYLGCVLWRIVCLGSSIISAIVGE